MNKFILGLFLILLSTYSYSNNWFEQYVTNAKAEILKPLEAKKNFSGLTYVPQTQSYYAIINKGDRLYEWDNRFNLKRAITLQGFDDPEDLTYLYMSALGPVFAISEEPGRILFGAIGSETTLNAQKMKPISLVDEAGRALSFSDNKGLEGIVYLPSENRIIVLKEKNPIKVWSFTFPEANRSYTVTARNYLPVETENLINKLVTDLSAVSFNEKENALVFLSDESSKYFYVDLATLQITKVVNIKEELQHEALSFSADFETTFVGSEPFYLMQINSGNTSLSR